MALTVAVVVATRDRPRQLAALRESLDAQTFRDFELVVVEDVDGRGPAWARNEGWRRAAGSLIVFVDDDCLAAPGWLEALVGAAGEDGATVVQGRVEPAEPMRPYSRSLAVRDGPGPWFQTANIAYPRAVLEKVGGFDADAFPFVGEDTDLAMRARAAGAAFAFAPEAVVHHDVVRHGPVGALRFTFRWSDSVRLFRRHPSLRSALTKGVFWKGSHYLLLRALLTLVLPRRLWGLAAWLWLPYALHLVDRWREEGGGPALAPWIALHDLVEMAAVARGAVRHRTLVL